MRIKELVKLLSVLDEEKTEAVATEAVAVETSETHPMLGKRCLVRTYSAGVHIGDVVYVNPQNSMECKLKNALRLWKWEGGGLSLSAVANNGIKGGRLNRTGEVYLTNAIEYIPTTAKAEKTYAKFVEDDDSED